MSHDLCLQARGHVQSIDSDAVRLGPTGTAAFVPASAAVANPSCVPFLWKGRSSSSSSRSNGSNAAAGGPGSPPRGDQCAAWAFFRTHSPSSTFANPSHTNHNHTTHSTLHALATPLRFVKRHLPTSLTVGLCGCTAPPPPPPTAVALLIQQLPFFPSLRHLALEYRNFMCEDAATLAVVLAATPPPPFAAHLQTLNISCNFLRKDGGRALGKCLRYLPSLHTLLLNDNSIYNEACAALCASLRGGSCPELRKLSLAWNWVGVMGSREVGGLVGSGAVRKLEWLDVKGNGITSVGLCFFVEAFLQEVEKRERKRREEEAEERRREGGGGVRVGGREEEEEEEEEDEVNPQPLQLSVYQRHYLHFHVPFNGTEEQPTPSSFPPSPCPLLSEMDFSYNYVGGEGARALAEAVEKGLFPALRSICLSHNSVDDASAQVLRTACGERVSVSF